MTNDLTFLAIIAVCVTIIIWYLQNERLGANGERGFLAIKPDPDGLDATGERTGPRYRMKPRLASRARDRRSLSAVNAAAEAAPAYRKIDDAERARNRFRRQDETRYRVKDKLTYSVEKKAD